MLPYWLMFALWAGGAVQSERRRVTGVANLFFIAAIAVTTLMIGLRFEVGGDWGAYQRMYDDIYFLSLPASLSTTDAGYAALNWLAAQIGWGMSLVNTVCAILFMGGVARLAWRQPNPALTVLVAVPYFIIVVAMGYTRQAAAIGFICFAIADASEKHLLRLIVLSLLAALFHKTAILMLPIFLVPILRKNMLFGIIGGIAFLVLFSIILRGASNTLVTNYVQSNYDSQGAAVRILMNVAAAVTFIVLRKRIELPAFQKSFWVSCALLAIASVPALALSSASSGIDRISLYLIPLQLVTYSRLPYILSGRSTALPSLLIAIIGYAFLVQFIWLNYADNSGYWLPYKTILQDTN